MAEMIGSSSTLVKRLIGLFGQRRSTKTEIQRLSKQLERVERLLQERQPRGTEVNV